MKVVQKGLKFQCRILKKSKKKVDRIFVSTARDILKIVKTPKAVKSDHYFKGKNNSITVRKKKDPNEE